MVEITLGTIRRSRFVDKRTFSEPNEREYTSIASWQAKPGYEALVEKFIRNKILIKLSTVVDFDNGNDSHGNDIDPVIESIHEYCDENCSGLWTMNTSYRRKSDWTTGSPVQGRLGSGEISVHFENEEDIEPFLKNSAILIKLSN